MIEYSFDRFTRQSAAAITRRNALTALSSALLTAAAAGRTGLAAKDSSDKRKAKKIKKKFQQQCAHQREECRALLTEAGSVATLFGCCETCFANDFLNCLIDVSDQ
jgi:hypothetical protein